MPVSALRDKTYPSPAHSVKNPNQIRPMKLRSLLIALVCQPLIAFAADPLPSERLSEIIAMRHEDRLDDPALKVYPKAREYALSITSTQADGQSGTGEVTATEKWVDGRYIVSEAQPAGPETKFAMIVEYDRDSKRYRKYLLMSGKLVGYQEGTRIAESRSVAWIDLTSSKFDSDIDCLTTETHTDTGMTWNSIFFKKGLFQRSERGVAKVTKP